MLFPPPWFSPLGTPLSEAPPFKKGIRQGGEPIQGDTARLSSVYVSPPCTVNASSTCRGRQPLDTLTAWVAGTTPPLRQSPQPPREAGHTGRSTNSLLSARLPALGGRVGPGPARCTSHGPGLSMVSASRTSCFEPCPPPPSRPCGTPSAASSQAQKQHSEFRPQGGGRKPTASAARHARRAPSPYADKRSVRLPLSESRRLQDPPPALGGRRQIGADSEDGDHAKLPLGHLRAARILAAVVADRPGSGSEAGTGPFAGPCHENDARGSRTRPLNESTKVTAWMNPAGMNMRGGGWVLGRVRSSATLQNGPEPPPTQGLLAVSVSR